MKRIIHLILIAFLALTALHASAQGGSQAPQGRVFDHASQPLAGVTVLDKDNGKWAVTDLDGNFAVEGLAKGHTLDISCFGYAAQQLVYEGRTLSIVLQEEAFELEEAVAIGYGSARRKDLTGSVGVLHSSTLEQQSVTHVSQSLQGTMPGLVVTRSSSMPGASATVTIRGITTMSDNSPLILVDGMAVSSIDQVAPGDVEQITVLKDAASASIYGARAAAGVILITTKGAKDGDMNINYNGEFSIISPTEWQDYITDPVTYMKMFNEYKWNDAGNPVGGDYQVYAQSYIDNYMANHRIDPITYPDFDWKSHMLNRYATSHRHNLSMSYGNKTVKTRVSTSYESTDAIYEGSNYERLTARIRNSFNISPKISGDFDLSVKHADKEDPQSTPIRAANMYPRLYLGLYPDGRVAEGKRGSNALAGLLYGGSINTVNEYVTGKVSLTYRPFEGFSLTGSLNPTYSMSKKKNFNKAIPIYDAYDTNLIIDYVSGHETNDLTESRYGFTTMQTQLVANYENRFLNAHNVNFMVGYEDYSYRYETAAASATNMAFSEFPYLDLATYDEAAGKIISVEGNATENAYRSFFGRAMYNYKGRYYLQANLRTDGSSRFYKDYRWGWFPSASVGWVVSEEGFMRHAPFVDYLKLRASLGTLGNERIGDYPYQANVNFHDVIMFDGSGSKSSAQLSAAQTDYAVRDITWETTYTYDVGLDASLLGNRLDLSADYYYKETRDMLLEINIPSYVGYDNPSQNGGTMFTRGWEFKVGWKDRIGDFSYGASFNISDYKSIMGDLKGTVFLGDQIIKEGEEYYSWYGYKSLGILQDKAAIIDAPTQLITTISPGDIGYKDIGGLDGNPDGVVSAAYDKTILGSSLPHYVFGGSLNLGWKNWNLGVLFNGVGKQLSRLTTYMVQPFAGQWLSPPAVIKGKYWSAYNTEEQNRKAIYPRLSESSSASNNYEMSDYWLIDGSYLRIKNINLGYTVPRSVLKKVGVKACRVYFNMDDPFCFDHYLKGWDPEQSTNAYIARTYTLGFDIKF